MSLLLLLLLALLSSSALLSQSTVVRDTDGDALQRDAAYYMLAVKPSSAGGVMLAGVDPSRPGTCPTKLAVASSKTDKGIPVAVVPQDNAAKSVQLGKPAEFKFANLFHCIPTTSWALEAPGAKTRHLLPGRKDSSFDLFTVKYDKSQKAYTLNYNEGGRYKALGVKKVGSDQYLVLGGSSEFSFVFEKYNQYAQM